MSIVYLKIKIKSLAAESQMIRREELKQKGYAGYLLRDGEAFTEERDRARTSALRLVDTLALHRRKDVRNECRAAHLAYGYLRGRRYRQLEPCTHTPKLEMHKLFERASQLVKKYGEVNALAGFKAWCEEPAVQSPAIATQEVTVL